MTLVVLLLSGCSDHRTQACEAYIKGMIDTPATYKQVSADSRTEGGTVTVDVSYDAANAFGTPVRNSEICTFNVSDKLTSEAAPLIGKTAADIDRLNNTMGKPKDGCCTFSKPPKS